MVLIAALGALALATIPIALGWRRSFSDAAMARALGIAAPSRKRFDLETWALQTGTNLKPSQLLLGLFLWTLGGFLAGLLISPVAAVALAGVGFIFYQSSLSEKRQDFRMAQSRDILRALGLIETMLSQGRSLNDTLEEAARSVGQAGQRVIGDLVQQLRAAPVDDYPQVIRQWTQRWQSPGVDIMGTALIAAFEGRIEIASLVGTLRTNLGAVMDILSRARAASAGAVWQARFIGLVPTGVILFINLIAPEFGRIWTESPIFLIPVVLGSVTSYLLSMNMIRNGLSLEASIGLTRGRVGEIPLDRMGRLL